MAAFFELTLKDGRRILIGKAWVMDVTDDPTLLAIYGTPPGQCLIELSGSKLLVQESYDTVKQFILQPD